MSLVDGNSPVQTFPTHRADQALAERVGLRRPHWRLEHMPPHRRDRPVDHCRINAVPIMEDEAGGRLGGDNRAKLLDVHSAVGCSVTFQWTWQFQRFSGWRLGSGAHLRGRRPGTLRDTAIGLRSSAKACASGWSLPKYTRLNGYSHECTTRAQRALSLRIRPQIQTVLSREGQR